MRVVQFLQFKNFLNILCLSCITGDILVHKVIILGITLCIRVKISNVVPEMAALVQGVHFNLNCSQKSFGLI